MLTTTVDGLWVLQVLSGIEVLGPELGLRPHLPSVEKRATALSHPIAAQLHSAGVISDRGTVDAAILDWMTVLSKRETALLLLAQSTETGRNPERIVLARFRQWWVALERSEAMVRMSEAGIATNEHSAGLLISAQIERLCGDRPPASLRPVAINMAQLLSAVQDPNTLRASLISQRLDAEVVETLTTAASAATQISIVALQTGVEGTANCHLGRGAVTIIEAPTGRLVAEHIQACGTTWLMVSPGSSTNVASAVRKLLRGLPDTDHWYSSGKAV